LDVAHEPITQKSDKTTPSDPGLHKPGVAGSSPAAATDSVCVRFDEDILTYHLDKKWLGSSDLKVGEESPPLFHERVDLGVNAASDSAALELGKLWHTLRELGDDQFAERVTVAPDSMITQSGALSTRQEAKDWLASQAGKIVVTPVQADTLGKMRERFLENEAAVRLDQTVTLKEVSIRWVSTAGVQVKCRPDAICEGGVLVDWKSTKEQYPLRTFSHAVTRYGYGLSAALYEQGCVLAGLADPPMVFVVTSTVSPYETQVLHLPPAYMDWCRRRLDTVLEDIARRRRDGDWLPVGYGRVNEITMPGFGGDRGYFHID
jgi:hypothetical protein